MLLLFFVFSSCRRIRLLDSKALQHELYRNNHMITQHYGCKSLPCLTTTPSQQRASTPQPQRTAAGGRRWSRAWSARTRSASSTCDIGAIQRAKNDGAKKHKEVKVERRDFEKEAGNARCDRECGTLTKCCIRQSLAVPAARVSMDVHSKMAENLRAAASSGTELEAIAILLAVAAAEVSVEGMHVACTSACGESC